MIPALRSEFRKLFTLRSTYLTLLLMLIFIAFGSLYAESSGASQTPVGSYKLINAVYGGAMSIIPILTAVVVILLMAHEYRYNTISYSLTLANRRSKLLLAKFITSAIFTLVVTLAGVFLTMGLTYVGLRLKGLTIPHQDLMLMETLWRTLSYSLGYSLFGLALIILVRNLTAVIVLLFAGIGIVEQLMGLVLKAKADYLPFHALGRLVQPVLPAGTPNTNPFAATSFGPLEALGIFSIYFVILWAVSWYFFTTRDAS